MAHFAGLDGPNLYWCAIGTPLALIICYMVFLHATHHICRLAVTPGKIDRVMPPQRIHFFSKSAKRSVDFWEALKFSIEPGSLRKTPPPYTWPCERYVAAPEKSAPKL